MLDFLFSGDTVDSLSLGKVALSVGVAAILGLMISLTYLATHRKDRSENLPITLLVMPAIIGTVIMLIGNNIAGAFSLAGIFSVIKFRSVAGNAKEIVYILFCVAAGLAAGVGEYGIGCLVTLILCGLMFATYLTKFGAVGAYNSELKVLMPEDEDIEEALTPILTKYAENYRLNKIKTKDLGSVFEVVYLVKLKRDSESKKMIDAIRVVNGNMKISFCKQLSTEKEF
jgi:type III secretory pathway component EscS